MNEQTPYGIEEQSSRFDVVEFAENPEPRCPCILLLDCSGSMNGTPMNELNKGLQAFQEQLSNDDLASKRVEVTVLSFHDYVEVINEFETAENFTPKELEAGGLTSMGKAIDLIHDGEKRKQFAFFAVGIQGANMNILKQISVREPLPLKGLNFTSLFQWLSNSMSSVSRSSLDAEIALESPSGWAKI